MPEIATAKTRVPTKAASGFFDQNVCSKCLKTKSAQRGTLFWVQNSKKTQKTRTPEMKKIILGVLVPPKLLMAAPTGVGTTPSKFGGTGFPGIDLLL
jgi:hypothetical protein